MTPANDNESEIHRRERLLCETLACADGIENLLAGKLPQLLKEHGLSQKGIEATGVLIQDVARLAGRMEVNAISMARRSEPQQVSSLEDLMALPDPREEAVDGLAAQFGNVERMLERGLQTLLEQHNVPEETRQAVAAHTEAVLRNLTNLEKAVNRTVRDGPER